jgi:hypothetical protein
VGEDEGDGAERGEQAQARPAHLGQPGQLRGHGSDLVDRLPRRLVVEVGAPVAPAAQQQGDEHHCGEHAVEGRHRHAEQRDGAALVPVDAELEHPEGHGGEADDRQVHQAAEQQGGERAQQDAQAEHRADREPEDASPHEGGGEGEQRRDRPHQRLQPLHRDTEQRRPVGAVGRGADGDAQRGALEEHHQAEHQQRRGDHGDDAVGAEDGAAELEADVEGVGDAGRDVGPLDAEPAGHEHGDAGEELGEADRGHREHQPWGGEEAPDDRQLDDPAEGERGGRTGRHGRGVGPPPLGEQDEDEHRRGGTEVALGEVDDAVRPVDQRHAEGDQGGDATDDDAAHPDPEGQRVGEQLQEQDRHRWRVRQHSNTPWRPPPRRGRSQHRLHHPFAPWMPMPPHRRSLSSGWQTTERGRGYGPAP